MFARRNSNPLTVVNQRRLLDSALFGQKIIVDFAYQDLMPPTDYTGLCKQMSNIFISNYEDNRPFDLWMCNLPTESRLRARMAQMAPPMFHPRSLCSITDRSILELGIAPERLVYLSPDAPDKLTTFDENDVYILGAFVDRNDNRPESLLRAQQANIRSARLPLEDHINWTNSNFNLPMYSVFRMLLHMKQPYGYWKHAILQFAPKCKQLDELETMAEYQPKVFNRLLRSDYAYVKSRQVNRDRLLVNKLRKTGLV
jgi:hypothetical protein